MSAFGGKADATKKNEVSDGELEAAASDPTIGSTLSIVLFACRFLPTVPSSGA
jgi:hypothetical protein